MRAIVSDFEQIATGVYLEGLAVDEVRNAVWYSDVIAGGIHGVRPDGTTLGVLNPDRMWTGGVMMNADGSVLSSGPGGIMWNNPDTGRSGWLIREIGGQLINGINEMMPDGTGGIFFGTNDVEMIAAGGQTRPTAIYRLTSNGELIKLAGDIGFSNGIMLSPDRKRLYCNDTFNSTFVFDVDADLFLSNKRMFVEKDDCDGMTLDAEGNVWITGYRSGDITRAAPDGSQLPPFKTPGGGVPQIRFGGADLRDVYINTVPVDAGDTLKVGEIPTEKRSILYRGRSDVAGMPIPPARFDLG